MDKKKVTLVIKHCFLTLDRKYERNWETNLQITFLHNHQMYLGIYLNARATCLTTHGKNYLSAHWTSSREFSHHWLKIPLFQISIPLILVKGNIHWGTNLGCKGVAPYLPLELLKSFMSLLISMGPGIAMKEDDTITQHEMAHSLHIRNESRFAPPSKTSFVNALPFQSLWRACELTLPNTKFPNGGGTAPQWTLEFSSGAVVGLEENEGEGAIRYSRGRQWRICLFRKLI